ncbi:hypothetical protein AXF42_Ash010554 [Apostasia shenzhenica]|uniref:Uncharacterized protein n=1 Tax=Apostasia shenzhenica TaxID=1088818 RepID=A0A2I0A6F5_9ASPA|nr:hypothetical protein AXF42_Ash010554 [Apostasia shenzhenica]
MDGASERERSSRKSREEGDRDRDKVSAGRDRERDGDHKKHRHHHSGEERKHERHRRSSVDHPPESERHRRDRSSDRHREGSVERRHRSRGESPFDLDRDGDRRHRRSSREEVENDEEWKRERSSDRVRKSVEREGYRDESVERRHSSSSRKRKDHRGDDDEGVEHINGKRARYSDEFVEGRRARRRFEDKDLEDGNLLAEDSKEESKRVRSSTDRKKDETMVVDEVKMHIRNKEEVNGVGNKESRRHEKRVRSSEVKEKLDVKEGKDSIRKGTKARDEVREEKLVDSAVAKLPNSVDHSGDKLVANGEDRLTSGSLANASTVEPFAAASMVAKISANPPSIHKVSSINATNENEGVSIIRSDEVTGKSSTDGTTSSVAGKTGSLSRDALAKAKKALQMQKELSEKLKKIPMLNKQPNTSNDSLHSASNESSSAPALMIQTTSKLGVGSSSENALAASGSYNIPGLGSAASYEAVKRAQELAAKMGFRQDPEFAPLINMFPGTSLTDMGPPQKSTKVPVLRLDAQGREIDEHGNVINRPKVTNLSTLKVNINKQKKEAFQILRPELDANAESNAHFDPSMGVNKTKLMRPKRSSFQFVEEGKWSKQAEIIKIKNQFGEAQAKELKVKQSQLARAKAEPDDNPNLIAIGERTFKEKKKDEIPEIEWWDKSFLPSSNYHDFAEGKLNLEKVTIYVEHPRPIEPPVEPAPPPPQPLKLTKKEQKKLRTQRRLAKERDRQEMIRQGLLEPPKPKVKMSNLMKVLSSEATQDPTKLEKEVRAAALEREQAHMDRNIARKLTPQERREKKEKKLFEDPSTLEALVSVFRINNLSHPQTRFKVDVNAQENRLSGCAVISDGISVVVVEGVRKSIKRYGKLMLKRINWAAAIDEDEDGDENPEQNLNKCVLVWQGSVAKPNFNRFLVHQCRSEAAARKIFADAGVPHYWDLSVNFSDELL